MEPTDNGVDRIDAREEPLRLPECVHWLNPARRGPPGGKVLAIVDEHEATVVALDGEISRPT